MSEAQPPQVECSTELEDSRGNGSALEQELERLRGAEQRHRQLSAALQEGTWEIDADGVTTYVDERMAEMLGYAVDGMLGRHLFDFLRPEVVEECRRRLEERLRGIGDRHEFTFVHKDGSERHLLLAAAPVTAESGEVVGAVARVIDITESRSDAAEREITARLLRQISVQNNQHELMRSVTALVQEWSGCEAVGIRLREGEDYPYYETRGIPPEFVRAENHLCALHTDGSVERDSVGNPVLECICGNVLRGRFDPRRPFFTESGSFWTNSTTELLASTSEADRQARTRNRCHGEGYESVALVPLRQGGDTFGLLQFNDRRRGLFDATRIALFERLAANLAIGLGQRRAIEALRASEARFRLALLATNDVIWDWDVIADAQRWNAAGGVVFGWLDIVDRPQTCEWWVERVHPDDREWVAAGFHRVVADPTALRWQDEYRFRAADGHYAHVLDRGYMMRDRDGRAVRMVGAMLDITERTLAAEARRASELRYHTVADFTYDWETWEAPNGSWEYVSPASERVTGYRPAEFQAQPDLLDQLVLPEDRAIWDEHRQAERDSTREAAIQIRIRRRDGGVRWIEHVCQPVRDERGQFLGCRASNRDISERKLAEAERQELEAQLRQSQKLEAVGQLAGGVAHDFNNLLTAILGNVEMSLEDLRVRLGTEHTVVKSIEEVGAAAERAAVLTRQLLTFSRRDMTQPTVLNLNEVLEHLDGMLRRLITEDIELEVIRAPGLRAVRADAGQIEQVIVNLVVNAAQAMPRGGRLTLKTENVELDEAYARTHTKARPGPQVVLTVTDTGHGMDAATLERIFEPFFTTKVTSQGTGLGLATVHGIVKRSGGHITVISEPERGATFRVYLPAVERHVAEAAPVSPVETARRGNETVLLCEDDAPVRVLMGKSLRSAGYTVLEAGSGHEGLRVAKEHKGVIDLLITDVIMPDMNGRALAQRLSAARPGLPTLFISGYAADIIAERGVLDAGVAFLAKPFTRQRLLRKVWTVLRRVAADQVRK